ncbi:hypothetical protein ACA910_000261 [Epithemia clementina (nom. ined.)]
MARDDSATSFSSSSTKRTTIARFRLLSSEEEGTKGTKQQVQNIGDYQSGSMLVTAPFKTSSFYLDVTIENDVICLGHLHCKKKTETSQLWRLSPSLGKDGRDTSNGRPVVVQTSALEGIYHHSSSSFNQNFTDSIRTGDMMAAHFGLIRLSQPGIFGLIIPPIRAVTDMIFSSWMTISSLESKGDKSLGSSSLSSLPFRRNPNKQQTILRSGSSSSFSSPIWIVLLRPTMLLLMILQIGLAFCYWIYKISPSAVAQDYNSIMAVDTSGQYQAWRLFSGATAHFDLWHIGINMFSFYNLSLHLENGGERLNSFSSLEYLGMNLSLIALVGAVWLGLQHHFVSPQQRGPTVGYSGVLFAWSTIVTLSQPPGTQMCPIPFLPNTCFSTITVGTSGIPVFSWAPLVQLVLAQVLLPRVSWTGHLAGVIIGFLYVWGLVPFLAFPSIHWSLLHLLYLRCICSIEWRHQVQRKLFIIHAAALLFSMIFASGGFLFGPTSISFGTWFLFDCYMQGCERNESVLRGYVVATVLNLITQTLSLGTRTALLSLPLQVQPFTDLILWLQWILYLAGLLRAISLLTTATDVSVTGSGIFALAFGPILLPSSSSSSSLAMYWPCGSNRGGASFLPLAQSSSSAGTRGATSGSLFPGSGRALGGGGAGAGGGGSRFSSPSGTQRSRLV